MRARMLVVGLVGLLVVVAVAGAGLLVVRRSRASDGAIDTAPRAGRIEAWDQLRDSVAVSIETPAHEQQIDNAYAQPVGGPRIPMRKLALQVDLLTDFDCVPCREVEQTLQQLLRRRPVHSRSLIHFPSSASRWSVEAAKAFECAYDDGQGNEMYQTLRRRQMDFGRVTWDSLAREAQVYDTTAFSTCMAQPPNGRIQGGIALARKLGLREAPAVVVDGWLVSPLTEAALAAALDEAVARRRTGR